MTQTDSISPADLGLPSKFQSWRETSNKFLLGRPCNKCGEPRTPGNTRVLRFSKNGNPQLAGYCRPCEKIAVKASKQKNPHQYLAARRQQRVRTRTQTRIVNNRWKKSHSERVTQSLEAAAIVRKAIQSGTLVRPNVCEFCGTTEFTEAAHYDYRKPLEVLWLCRRCHRKWDHAAPKTGAEND